MRAFASYRRTSMTVLATALALLCSTDASAQKETWNWYFGQNAGLTFRDGSAVPLTDGAMVTDEGCATQSDPVTGALLFYTNGQTVWNRNHQVMMDGTGLSGDPSTSQTVIVPAPGNPFLFYIFNAAPITSNNINGRCFCLTYSLVDLRRERGMGAVTLKNVVLVDDITEHVTATRDCQGEGYWVVVRRRSSRHFLAFRVDSTRVHGTYVQSDGSNPQLIIRDAGQMHISPDGRKLVITSTSGNSQLYAFDPASGLVSNGTSLFPDAGEPSAHYGAAFSHDSRYVYIAATSSGGTNFYRFRTDLSTPSAAPSSIQWLYATNGRNLWVPMQLGPDRRIYIGNPNERSLSVIERPWRIDPDSVAFVVNAISLPEGRVRNGLPNFMGTSLFPDAATNDGCEAPRARFTMPDRCANECLPPSESSAGAIESFEWLFPGGIPERSTARFPGGICYPSPGRYTATLVVRNSFGSDTATAVFEVFPKPRVVTDSTIEICQGASATLRAAGAHRYAWSPNINITGAQTASPTVAPRFTTRYTVVGTTDNGCSDTASVLVRVVEMKAGPDVTVCRGGRVRLTSSGGTRYSWQPANVLDDPTSPAPWATIDSTTTFVVRIERDTCVFVDTLVATVVESTTVRTSGDTTMCHGTSVTLRAITAVVDSVLWWPSIGLDNPASLTPKASPTTTTTYHVRVWVGTCTATDSLTVTVLESPTIQASTPATICSGDSTSVSVQASANTRLSWWPTTNIDDPTSATPRLWPRETTTYVVTATAPNGCQTSDSVVITVGNTVSVDAGPDRWICPGQVTQLLGVSNTTSYRWYPVEGLSDPTDLSTLASPSVTTTYYLVGTLGSCSAIDSVTVTVSTLSELRVTPDTVLCRGRSMRLEADGTAIRYEWSPPQGLSDPTSAAPFASPTETTTYTLRAIDAGGCESTARVTITVVDNPPITLRVGNAVAPAGTTNVAIPIVVEVDPAMLPLVISNLRLRLSNDLTIFLPTGADAGQITYALCGGTRCTYLLIDDLAVLTPSQRVTTIRGTALLGAGVSTPLTIDDVSWVGNVQCPNTIATNGSVSVTGCNIGQRFLRQFEQATLNAMVLHDLGVIRFVVGGNAPGHHTLRLVAIDGSVVWESGVQRGVDDAAPTTIDVSAPWLSAGLYFAQLLDPFGSVTTVQLTFFR